MSVNFLFGRGVYGLVRGIVGGHFNSLHVGRSLTRKGVRHFGAGVMK